MSNQRKRPRKSLSTSLPEIKEYSFQDSSLIDTPPVRIEVIAGIEKRNYCPTVVRLQALFSIPQLSERRNAPPPSKSSGGTKRSLAPKPGVTGEIFDSCLSKLGRICQGLLGGLCLFFLILLLTAGNLQLRSLFGNAGGQGQLLQMLIYLLVIVSVIASFEG